MHRGKQIEVRIQNICQSYCTLFYGKWVKRVEHISPWFIVWGSTALKWRSFVTSLNLGWKDVLGFVYEYCSPLTLNDNKTGGPMYGTDLPLPSLALCSFKRSTSNKACRVNARTARWGVHDRILPSLVHCHWRKQFYPLFGWNTWRHCTKNFNILKTQLLRLLKHFLYVHLE